MSAALAERVGEQLDEVRLPLERSKVRELVRALGDDPEVYSNQAAALPAGHEQVPAPLTATVLAMHWREHGEEDLVSELGLDLRRILHGESSWEYLAPVHVGDELTGRRRIAAAKQVAGKRGGEMTLIIFETEFRNQVDELVILQRDTMIERGEG